MVVLLKLQIGGRKLREFCGPVSLKIIWPTYLIHISSLKTFFRYFNMSKSTLKLQERNIRCCISETYLMKKVLSQEYLIRQLFWKTCFQKIGLISIKHILFFSLFLFLQSTARSGVPFIQKIQQIHSKGKALLHS